MSSDATAGQKPDVYGQLHPVETPELMQSKLEEFQHQFDQLPIEERQWAQQATETNPNLTTPDFKLMFLRCEVFNADLAAQRYASYWKKRVEILGPDRAFLPFTLDQALKDPNIQTAFHMGVMTLLDQVHDPSGRAIVYFDPSQYDRSKYTLATILPALWYVLHAALETTTAQQRGLIFIGDPGRAKLSQFDRVVTKELISSLRGILPVRLSAYHLVHPPSFVKIILPIVKLFMSERMKKRIIVHTGKEEVVLQNLETKYGLTRDMLPTTIGGKYNVQHSLWAQQRQLSGL
jgi:hypothetical protein